MGPCPCDAFGDGGNCGGHKCEKSVMLMLTGTHVEHW